MLKLREGGHADLTRFYTLFEVDFDSEELISKLSLHKGLMNGSVELLVMYDDESQLEMAYALCFVKGMYDYVLLKYFGVLPWYREKGLGVEAMRLLNKRYADRQGIIAEITEFADPDPEHLKKLFKFFARFGYVEIDRDYRISGARAHLFVKPIKGTWDIAPIVHRILNDHYSRCLTRREMARMIDIRPYEKKAE